MKKLKKIILIIISLVLIIFLISFVVNTYVKKSTEKQIKKINEIEEVDAIIVLGASIRPNGNLSPMLRDRLVSGIDLYNAGWSTKIIMSGDHSRDDYNEVTAMKSYAIQNGIKSSDIYLDHLGISTYDSIYRAKNIFNLKKVVIVTQKYHLYRALYIANKLGLEAYGIAADTNIYSGQGYRDLREYLARNKDFVKGLYKPKSTYIGDKIDINASGDLTN